MVVPLKGKMFSARSLPHAATRNQSLFKPGIPGPFAGVIEEARCPAGGTGD